MSCSRVQEIDLMAFAAARRSEEWADFRDHYPRCTECARAVEQLSTLQAKLGAHTASGSGHLDEDQMLAMAEGALAESERLPLDRHLESCPACRTELAVLRSFDVQAAVEAAAEAPAGETEGPREVKEPAVVRTLVTRLIRPSPALALAATILLILLAAWGIARFDSERSAPSMAENPESLSTPAPTRRPLTPLDTQKEDDSTTLAKAPARPTTPDEEPTEAPERTAPPTGLPEPESAPEVLAVTPPPQPEASPRVAPGEAPPPRVVPTEAPAPSEVQEEVPVLLLAANLPAELPSYSLHPSLGASELEVLRMSAGLRSSGDSPRLSVLAPEHKGLTQREAPTLYWALDRRSEYPIEIVVNHADDLEPLLEKLIPAPIEAGIHALELGAERVALAEDRPYEWSASLILNPERREADLVSLAVVERVAGSAAPSAQSAAGPPAREVHDLAQAGYWYDAFDQLEGWLEAAPELERLHAYRRALLAQVGLEPVAEWIEEGAAREPARASTP